MIAFLPLFIGGILVAGRAVGQERLPAGGGREIVLPHAFADSIKVNTWINGKDTIPWISLPELVVMDKMPRYLRKRLEEWTRLRNAVYITYPYAKAAAFVLKDVDAHLAKIKDKKQQKIYLAQKEKELKAQFGNKLEDLSIYQGKILVKLIYRQTGNNCYDIIRELKGGFNARLWQTVAFFFGGNLKTAYDRQEDMDIETIVREIDRGDYYY